MDIIITHPNTAFCFSINPTKFYLFVRVNFCYFYWKIKTMKKYFVFFNTHITEKLVDFPFWKNIAVRVLDYTSYFQLVFFLSRSINIFTNSSRKWHGKKLLTTFLGELKSS